GQVEPVSPAFAKPGLAVEDDHDNADDDRRDQQQVEAPRRPRVVPEDDFKPSRAPAGRTGGFELAGGDSRLAHASAASRARPKSASRSSGCSRPTDTRSRLSGLMALAPSIEAR